MEMVDLLQMVTDRGGSDLILAVGVPPVLRVNRQLVQSELDPLTPREAQRLIFSILTDEQRKRFEDRWELDFSYSVPGLSRFRANVHKQRGSVAAAFRSIPDEIPSLDALNLPEAIVNFCNRDKGLILVTGPAGSGKSTTLARMIDIINTRRACHIITVEDPIEFLFKHKRSVIEQREVANDTHSFSEALKYALRQDPDVLMIGELRDQETIQAAITSAETGHLVLATLHTINASQTIDRVIDVFPPHHQQQVRIQLSSIIEGIVSQILVPQTDGKGVILAAEVLVATPAVRNLIRERNTHQINGVLQTGSKYGMQTFEQSLLTLYRQNKISKDALVNRARELDLERLSTGEVE
ncbi:MAG: type IV pilus twitching motility protein PilT [Candidatus Omnitrophica bacterium]|nr:type IV pilus twitching motility protein PilT [Candidatus Omnitrophota bacterium]